MFSEILEKLTKRNDLDQAEMESIMNQLMTGELTQAQVGALLVALRMKGESTDEITAAARIMRKHATSIDAGAIPIVDTCGTGGDGANTFNISTVAAFIAAGAGVPIAKHGNRSVSSKCGSADVLAELGVNINIDPAKVSESIRAIGIGFLFAPSLHPAMKFAVGPRRELGIRTMFNMLGPLTNPAGAKRHVLGVFDQNLTSRFAEVLNKLGCERALIVHGLDHLDEITVTDKTQISELRNGEVETYEFDPLPYIGSYQSPEVIKGGDARENAHLLREILKNRGGARQEIAVLNGAAAIYIAGADTDFSQAVEAARESIASGNAMRKLEALIEFSNE